MPIGIYKRTKKHCQNISKAKKEKRTSMKTEFQKNHGRLRSLESYKKDSKRMMGRKNPNYKNGETKSGKGYKYRLSPNHPYKYTNNRVSAHRLVMEKHLGRYLKSEEIVHHINGIKDDNRIENLMLFPNSRAHQQFYHFGKKSFICKFCNKNQRT